MPSPQRQSRLYSIAEHCRSHIGLLKDEVEIAISNPIYVPGHNEWHREVENKLAEIAEYESIVDVIERHFNDR